MKAFSSLIFTVQKPELYMHVSTMSPLAQMLWARSPSIKPAISLFSRLIHKY
jgi:hypothetical protein